VKTIHARNYSKPWPACNRTFCGVQAKSLQHPDGVSTSPIAAHVTCKACRRALTARQSEPHIVGTDAPNDENDPIGRYPRGTK